MRMKKAFYQQGLKSLVEISNYQSYIKNKKNNAPGAN